MQFEHMHHIHFLYSLPTGSEVSISIDMEAEQDFMNRVSKYDSEIFRGISGKLIQTKSKSGISFPEIGLTRDSILYKNRISSAIRMDELSRNQSD